MKMSICQKAFGAALLNFEFGWSFYTRYMMCQFPTIVMSCLLSLRTLSLDSTFIEWILTI